MDQPKIDLRPDHWLIVHDILRRHVPDRAVWAFGSRATWTAKESSDLDLAVLGDSPLPLAKVAALEEAFAESDLPFKVDVVDWNQVSDSFQRHIQQGGIVLMAGNYRDSGDWTSIRLGEVCTKIGSGATPRGGSAVYLDEGPYSLIRSQNVYNDGFRRDGLVWIDEVQAAALESVAVLPSDVLLNITGDSVARCCQVASDVLPARVNQHVAIIRPDRGILDPQFLRYALVTPEMQSKLLQWASAGATRNALTKGMIEAIVLAVPSLSDQRAIAHILGTLDDKIDLNRRMNATLEAMARALFKSWFVDFDPVRAKAEGRDTGLPPEIAALFPDSFEESELGEVPRGWSRGKVNDLCASIFSGGTPSTQKTSYWGGEIPWLSSGETRSTFITQTEKSITAAGVANSSTRLAPAMSTVIASAGQGNTRGQTSFLTFATYVNQSVVVLTANPTTSSPYHLFFDLERRYEEFRRVSDAHSSRGSLTTKLLAGLDAVLPHIEIVHAFDGAVKSIVMKIANGQKDAIALAAVRDSLLPQLVSGELRTRPAAHILGED